MRAKLVSFAMALCLASGLALADRVELNNGDVLTGTVIDSDGSKLTLRTAAAGDVKINLKDIKTFSTDAPIDVKLKDGTSVDQKATPATQGSVTIDTPAGVPETVELDKIKAVNPPPIKWTGSVTAGAVIARGNTYTDEFHAGFDLLRRSDENRVTADGSYNFGKQEDPDTGIKSTTTDNWMAEGKFDVFFPNRPKWYGFTNALVAKDRIQDLNLRFIPGAGVGYQWAETPKLGFNTEAGLSWVYEDYSSQANKEETAARLAYHLSWGINDRVKLLHDFEYIPSLDFDAGYLINTNAAIRADLTSSFFLEAKVVLTWNSQPAPDKSKSDVQYILGAGWKF